MINRDSWARGRPRAERPPVRISVVVAIVQTRTLKAEAEKGSARTAFGRGSVGPEGKGDSGREGGAIASRGPARGPSGRTGRAPRRKGTGSTSPDRDAEGSSGDANEPGDVDGGSGEGSLPSSTASRPALEIGSAGDRAGRSAERPGLRDVRSAPAGP